MAYTKRSPTVINAILESIPVYQGFDEAHGIPPGYSALFDINLDTLELFPTGQVVRDPPSNTWNFASSFLDFLSFVPAVATLNVPAFAAGAAKYLVPAAIEEFGPDRPPALPPPRPTPISSAQLGGASMANGDFFGDLFSGDLFSDFSLSDYLPSSETFSQFTNFVSPIASSFLAPQTTNVAYRPPTGQLAGPPMNGQAFPVASGGVTALQMRSLIIRPILLKVGAYLRLPKIPTINQVLTWARQFAGSMMTPLAIAASLGLTATELATLIVHKKKRRRMNPGNVKALRRSMRRVTSFHHLCSKADLLKTRGRRSGGSRCGTCKKSPCRC